MHAYTHTHMRGILMLLCAQLALTCAPTSRSAQQGAMHAAHVAFAVEEGSALDVSFLLDSPAGRHGPTVNRDGNLTFSDGNSARFWGVNFAWEAQYPSEEQIAGIVSRLRSSGINMVRVTYLDHPPPRGLVTTMSPAGLATDAARWDKLDRFAVALIEGGVYLDVVLLMGGPVSDVPPGVLLRSHELACLQMFHPGVKSAHTRFIESFLRHRNPYTNRTWAEEPGLAILEVYNEGDPFYLRKRLRAAPEELRVPLDRRWAAWAGEQGLRGAEPFDVSTLDGDGETSRDAIRFLSQVQERHAADMRALVRRCGYRGVVCDTAGGAFSPAARWAQRSSDIHVAHYYHDHLTIDKHGSSVRNRPACRNDFRSLLVASWERDSRRPFVLGEWDFCWPNEYRAEGVLATAAFAAMQSWAGCLQFTYWSKPWDDAGELLSSNGRISGIWRIMSDPAVMALYPAAALLFLRGDVRACTTELSPQIDALTVRNWPPAHPRAFLHRFAPRLQPDGGPTDAPAAAPSRCVSDTGQLIYDREKGFAVIDAPRSQAVVGMVGGVRTETADVVFEVDNPFAVVALSSLTDAPLRESPRLLVTAVARAQNSDFRFEKKAGRCCIRDHGTSPILAESVTGRITLKGRRNITARLLRPSGARGETCRLTPTDVGLQLELGAPGPGLHYEITAGAD